MCGIFAYIGKSDNASKIVFEGLKLLEYRGYDSWGIATIVENGKLKVEKSIGKISDPELNSELSILNSKLAIGHTRWATHGGVTKINAHPHMDCTGKISAVHNGIIENYEVLRTKLENGGHKLISQTDTEVAVHLVEEYSKKLDFKDAVTKAFNELKGLNCFLFLNDKGQIFAAKKSSPLSIGLGKDEIIISSDPNALLPFTKKAVFLEDNQVAEIKKDGVNITNSLSKKIFKPKITELDWTAENSSLGKFKHYMLKEIYEQPKILKTIAGNGKDVKKLSEVINKAKGTFFVACGSASYAALSGTYLFSTIAKKHVNFSIGSEFNYLEDYINNRSLIIPISQSGESVDVIEPALRAKEKGAKIIGLVNVRGSTLQREANFTLFLQAGPEKAVCATKSWTAMIACLIYLSYSIAGKPGLAKKIIETSISETEKILKPSYQKKIKILAKKLSNVKDVYIIGRGLSYPTALEATLKLKEVSYIHSEGFAGGELKHGVIALIEKGTPCIVFAPNDKTYDAVISNAIEIKARGGYIIGISHKDNKVFDFYLPVGDCKEGSIIASIIPIQLLSYYIALIKKLDPDKPRSLAKSVTVR